MFHEVNQNRKINLFPLPYKENLTHYNNEFNPVVKNYVANECNISDYLKICKVIVVGDLAVGKTSIVYRFCKQTFCTNYKTTIGVDFEVEHFTVFDIPFTIQIWDTAGQEKFRAIAKSYYRNANAIITTFDLSSLKTLANCANWLCDALNSCELTNPLIFLVGTKKDLLSPSALQSVEELAGKLANEINAEYWSVSSKTGGNIERFFHRVAALAFEQYILRESQTISKPEISTALVSIKKSNRNKKKRNGCEQICKQL